MSFSNPDLRLSLPGLLVPPHFIWVSLQVERFSSAFSKGGVASPILGANAACSAFAVVGDMNIANKRPVSVGNELVPFFHMKRACHSLARTCT